MLRFFKYLHYTAQALHTVFSRWHYSLLALITAIILLVVSLFIPVWFIPGNTLSLTLSIMRPENVVVLVVLSLASGILIAVNVYLFNQRKGTAAVTSGGGIGLLASFIGSVFATSCGCGIGFIVGIFGISFGGVSLLIAHQFIITLASLLLVLVGLHLSIKRVAGTCSLCTVSSGM